MGFDRPRRRNSRRKLSKLWQRRLRKHGSNHKTRSAQGVAPSRFFDALEPRVHLSVSALSVTQLPGAGSAWNFNDGGQLNSSAIVIDVDGNGSDEIVVAGGDNKLYAYTYNGSSGEPNVFRTYEQTGTSHSIQATPAAFTLPGVGRVIVAAATDGRVFMWNANTQALISGWPGTNDIPDGTHPQDWLRNNVYGGITHADLDRDGSPEILVPSINHRLTAFRADGSVYWSYNNDDTILGPPAVGDINGDGLLEVVFGGDSSDNDFYDAGGHITVLSHDGKRMWVKQINQVTQSQPVLVDLDNNGFLDIVIGTGFNFQTPVPSETNYVYALDKDGDALTGWPYHTTDDDTKLAGVYASPVLGDLNGDGQMDVVVADGLGKLHAIKADGTALWTIQAFSEQKLFATPILADLNGDGVQDVVAATATTVYGFSGTDGSQIFTHVDGTELERYLTSPAVGNFKGDGTYQMAFVGNYVSGGKLRSPATLHVYDLDTSAAAPAWPMYRRDASGNVVVRNDSWSTTYVNNLYDDALNRTPTSGELSAALSLVRNAASLEEVTEEIIGGEAARAVEIDRWYTHFLGRTVDSGGLAYWQGFLESGHSFSTAQTFIVASQEAFNVAGGTNSLWVDYMYQKLLNRTPSSADNTYWTNLLDGGTPRASVTFGFFFSQEYTENQIRAWYTQYEPGGLTAPGVDSLRAASWDLRRGINEEQVIDTMLVTNGDYVQAHREALWIKQMYNDVLGRTPGATEIQGWLTNIEGGMTLNTVTSAIIQSYEYRARLVEEYYTTYLHRSTSGSENSNWVIAVGNGTQRKDIILGFVGSDEYWVRSSQDVATFINNVYTDMLGRSATSADIAYWTDRANNGFYIRYEVPSSLLGSSEYRRNLLDSWHVAYWRRLANTQDDLSALSIPGATYGAQDWENYLEAGGNPENIQVAMLVNSEYLNIAHYKSIWLGKRWDTLE